MNDDTHQYASLYNIRTMWSQLLSSVVFEISCLLCCHGLKLYLIWEL